MELVELEFEHEIKSIAFKLSAKRKESKKQKKIKEKVSCVGHFCTNNEEKKQKTFFLRGTHLISSHQQILTMNDCLLKSHEPSDQTRKQDK